MKNISSQSAKVAQKCGFSNCEFCKNTGKNTKNTCLLAFLSGNSYSKILVFPLVLSGKMTILRMQV